MKLYKWQITSSKTKFSISVDPGIFTSGFTFIDSEKNVIRHALREDKESRLSGEFPVVLPTIIKATSETIRAIQSFLGFNPHNYVRTQVIIEYTFMQGAFSVGISTFVTLLVYRIINEVYPAKILFVPPKVVTMLINKQWKSKKPKDSEVQEFIIENFPHVKGQKLAIHICDSLLFSYLCHPTFYRKTYNIDLERPKLEVIDLMDHIKKLMEEPRVSKKRSKKRKRKKSGS